MQPMLDRLMQLWGSPPREGEQALADFRAVYADPVLLNGSPATVEQLVTRSRSLHAAFADLRMEVLKTVEAPGHLSVVFRQKGCHAGLLRTPLGDLEPAGSSFDAMSIDVLTIDDGLITEIWVVADELSRLVQLGMQAGGKR
jgi:hypothetical protein